MRSIILVERPRGWSFDWENCTGKVVLGFVLQGGFKFAKQQAAFVRCHCLFASTLHQTQKSESRVAVAL